MTGLAPSVPGLLGLPRDYLNAQLGAWRSGQRRALPPDCMAQVAQRLSPEDIGAVSAWLAAQPVPAHAAAPPAPSTPLPLACGGVAAAAGAASAARRDEARARPSIALGARRGVVAARGGRRRLAQPRRRPAAPAAADRARPRADAELVARGEYLVRAGNCFGCHTAPGGAPYAGGRAIETPFGIVYAPNLTPDARPASARGAADDFWRALHNGRSRDGRLLYPAFPYPNYTRVTRADADAMFAYLRSLPPVAQAEPAARAALSVRPAGGARGLARALLSSGAFEPDPAQVAAVEPRRLPGRDARPLQCLPLAPQRLRRDRAARSSSPAD